MINNVSFIKQEGGLGRSRPNQDYISGMLYYDASATQSTFQTVFTADAFTGSTRLDQAVNDFFRYQTNNQGELYIMSTTQSGTYDYEELKELQNYASGKVRQALVLNYDDVVGATAVSSLQGVVDDLDTEQRPLSLIFSGDYSDYADLTELPDLLTDGYKKVSIVGSKDSKAGTTIDAGAALLGCLAEADVAQNIGFVGQFNLTDGTNFQSAELVTGEALSSLNEAQLTSLKNKGIIFVRDFVDYSGLFFVDDYTLDLDTSDFKFIRDNRVIDKAIRQARASLIADVNRKVLLNADGTLSENLITYFEGKVSDALTTMVNNEELSSFNVTINPSQNILADSTLSISVGLLPFGIAKFIEVSIGFVLSTV